MKNSRIKSSSPETYSLTPQNRLILSTVPERWGRMDLISRVALIEIGATLRQESLLPEAGHHIKHDVTAGLIAGSRRGSLMTDLDYARSLVSGPAFASPALFSYTLPNIALAEAAIHYNFTGPVFSILSQTPFTDARKTAAQWLASTIGQIDFIVAGEIDTIPTNNSYTITASFSVIYA